MLEAAALDWSRPSPSPIDTLRHQTVSTGGLTIESTSLTARIDIEVVRISTQARHLADVVAPQAELRHAIRDLVKAVKHDVRALLAHTSVSAEAKADVIRDLRAFRREVRDAFRTFRKDATSDGAAALDTRRVREAFSSLTESLKSRQVASSPTASEDPEPAGVSSHGDPQTSALEPTAPPVHVSASDGGIGDLVRAFTSGLDTLSQALSRFVEAVESGQSQAPGATEGGTHAVSEPGTPSKYSVGSSFVYTRTSIVVEFSATTFRTAA